jgi:hypothetical protein
MMHGKPSIAPTTSNLMRQDLETCLNGLHCFPAIPLVYNTEELLGFFFSES